MCRSSESTRPIRDFVVKIAVRFFLFQVFHSHSTMNMARSKLLAQVTTLTSLSSTAVVWFILFSNRSLFYSIFHPSKHPLRFIALLLSVILNVKSLPFIWHLRLFNHYLYHTTQRHKAADAPDGDLFKSIITKGLHSPLYECGMSTGGSKLL